jgi:hypothetical protein
LRDDPDRTGLADRARAASIDGPRDAGRGAGIAVDAGGVDATWLTACPLRLHEFDWYRHLLARGRPNVSLPSTTGVANRSSTLMAVRTTITWVAAGCAIAQEQP